MGDFRDVLTAPGAFARAEVLEFPNPITTTAETFIDYSLTLSYVQDVVGASLVARFRRALREMLVHHHGQSRAELGFEVPFVVKYFEAV